MATAAVPAQKTICKCGNPIIPFQLGDKSYYGTSCDACVKALDLAYEQEKREQELASPGYQRRYADADFDNLHEPRPSDAIIEAVRMYAYEISNEKEPSGKGLYLWGPNGTGKTHLAVAVTRTIKSALFLNTIYLFDMIKESYSTNEVCRIFEQARWCKLLVLDDIGSERPSGWVQERLYALLNTRWDEMLSTVFTSNYSPTQLERRIDDDIPRSASRILANCLSIKIDGPDHRRFACAQI